MIYCIHLTNAPAVYADLDIEAHDAVALLLDYPQSQSPPPTLVGSHDPAALEPGGDESRLIEFFAHPGQITLISCPYQRED